MNSVKDVFVSVIIPNYNHAKYLRQRLDSVLGQTFTNFEVIILDDCSTDNSIDIIETYRSNPKISQIVVNKQNSGSPFLQWNKGIQLAKGDWIWIAESDDWCEPVFLEELVKKLNHDVSLAFCQSIVINQDGKKIWQTKWRIDYEEIPGKDFIHDYLSRGNYIVNASMCVFGKKFYEQVSSEFTRYKFIGDWVLWLELAALGKIVVLGKQLNYFRKHDGDVSGKAFRQGLGYQECFSFFDRLDKDEVIPANDRKEIFAIWFYEFLNDNRIEKKYRKEIYLQFRSRLGIKTFYFHFKNWAVKKIKNPLAQLQKSKSARNENFSAYP